MDTRKKTIAALTLGCKVNAYDTEAMVELFTARGYEAVDFDSAADVYLVNTCTVTSLGDKKSRQMLRRARRLNPGAIVVAAGCYAQTSPEEVLKLAEVDLVAGTKNRLDIVDAVEGYDRRSGKVSGVTDIMTERVFEPLTIRRLAKRTRAYLKIQEGCDRYCSYCIIPYARGHIRSRALAEVIDEVRAIARGGYKEVVLAGIHVASYGKDLNDGNDLLSVITGVHAVEGIERIRLSSIEPLIVTREFLTAVSALPKVCRHFHLSLQSGCDKTLARMNRRYTAAEYMRTVSLLREFMPGVAVTTDVIVGFPGETDENFVESLEFVRAAGFARIHVFPYSPKPKTPAAGFDNQVAPGVKSARAKAMIAVGDEAARRFLTSCVGKELEVLYETESSPGVYEGYSDNYITVRTESGTGLINQVRKVRIQSAANDFLVSEKEI